MTEYHFDDSAYIGQSIGRTHESLAYLGLFEFVGVCIECDDKAYLGLTPGRTTFGLASFLGLFEPLIVSPGPPPPNVISSGGGATFIASLDVMRTLNQSRFADHHFFDEPSKKIINDDEDAIAALLVWYSCHELLFN